MLLKEAIAILQTPDHPQRNETVALISEFITHGIPGIGFAMSQDKVPGKQRDEKVARALHGLAEADTQSVQAVVRFLSRESLRPVFHYFLEGKAERDAKCAEPIKETEMALTENAKTVAEYLVELEQRNGFKNDVDSVREAVAESADQLCIELAEPEVIAACDYVLDFRILALKDKKSIVGASKLSM